MDALAKLKPAFHAHGTVTAGNASQTSDGAAAALVMSLEKAQALGVKPLARFVACHGWHFARRDGDRTVYAMPKALRFAGLKLDDIDLIELNEAFAAQTLSVIQVAGLDLRTGKRERRCDRSGASAGLHGREAHGQLLGEMKRRGRGTAW